MYPGMFPAFHHLQVFGAVVEFVAVPVMHHVSLIDFAAHLFLGVIDMREFPPSPPVPVLLVAVDNPLFLENRRPGQLQVEVDSDYNVGYRK
jgi:hypothetical protein